MKLLFYCFANESTGLGHWYRSMALAQAARQRGHEIFVVGDRTPPDNFVYHPSSYLDISTLMIAMHRFKPDWIIVDLPDTLPSWLSELATCKICVLNGIGYDQADDVDLRVIQGVAGLELPKRMNRDNTLIGKDYVIIRPELNQVRDIIKKDRWLVWGGANDHMRLLSRFVYLCPDWDAVLILSEMTPFPTVTTPRHHIVTLNGGNPFMQFLGASSQVCAAMGVITWECAYLGIPCYVFSYSDIHLMFAKAMEQAGLIKAWPHVGLPDDINSFRLFMQDSFEVDLHNRPDGLGADRIIQEIETR